MSNTCYHLYVIYFTAGSESGLAMVAAGDERTAFQILQKSGNHNCVGYTLIQIRDIGMTTSCSYGLLMESYVNALQAYDAILNAANHFLKGEKGDTVWLNVYMDDEMYIHVVEDESQSFSMHLKYDEDTGYLEIL